jgi:zinc/manganese transport system substrate-binding protein
VIRTRLAAPAALFAASALLLAGCSGASTGSETAGTDERIQVVASTNVYGQIVSEIGGEAVEVTSIVSSTAQDPHSYEPTAQDQLTVSGADLVIENGGGYDGFIDALLEASGSEAQVLTAAEFSHEWPDDAAHDAEDAEHETEEPSSEPAEEHDHEGHDHIEGFNEHVWYDPHTIEDLAEAIATELGEIDPDDAETFTANAEAFVEQIAGVETALSEIEATDAGASVFVTEPVPVYLIEAAGLTNVTPEAFSEAVEEGQDVPPATLLEALDLLTSGEVRVVITNTQTGGAETTQVVDEAEGQDIPVIEFAETLPEGQTYISWMDENVAALAAALAR